MDPKRVVADGYDAVAERYAELEVDEWPRLRWLRELLGRLPPRAHVLDLGCGAGVPAAREIARRHFVTGVDISARQIALARRNVPGGVFFQADMAAIAFPAGTFDAVVCFYALDHVPREEHGSLLLRVREWLGPGGLVLLSVEDVDEPGTVGEWLGEPMFFSSFGAAATRRLVEEAGFVVERADVEAQLEQSREVPYAWVLARKP